MDEFREVKPELIGESEDVRNQNLNGALEDNPNYTTMGRLKRKMTDSNVASLEKEPKLEPLDERGNSSLALKLEPFLEDQFKEEEPIEEGYYELESNRNPNSTVPLPRYTIWDQRDPSLEGMEVKEEPLDAPTGNQDFEYGSSWNPVKEEEEEPDYAYEEFETSDYQLEEPKVEGQPCQSGSHGHPLPKYTIIWNQGASSAGERMWGMKERVLNEQPRSSWAPIKQKVYKLPTPEDVRVDVELPAASLLPIYCCLCGTLETPQLDLTNVHFKSELLILAVGLSIAGKLTVQKGQELMARKQSSFSCREHYGEADERIQKALESKSVLDVVVQGICPQMTMERFRERFGEFHEKHQLKKKPSRGHNTATSHCEICNREHPHTKMTNVTDQGAKYLLAISGMLQGYRKPAQAVSFVNGNTAKPVCIVHFKTTLNVILARLNLRSASEKPQPQDLTKLMMEVRMVWANCKPKQFWDTVRWFAVEPQTIAATRRRYVHTKPKPITSSLAVFLCSICSKTSPLARAVKETNMKLVIAVGACLSKHMEPTCAKEFAKGNDTKIVCRVHFQAAIPQILATLRILSLSDSPDTELAVSMTSLVNSLGSSKNVGYEEFIDMVTVFAEEYQLAKSR